jgi:hypothetical protein
MYRWVPSPEVPADQSDSLGLRQAWEHQPAAEEWLTTAYPDLLDAGVTAVSLVEEDRLVYGPMSLEA